ncbi:serine/threonine protein kinase [Primorskyibacter sp. 2E233]|uniref:serine/threonine protein kinase n=1 Tax=Primorskyibacter sp. 2E233 TaxID=3413431 RepID=UPI003BF05685
MNTTTQEQLADLPHSVGDELPPRTQLCYGQYTIEKFLNSGGFGVTYLAFDSLGRKVVIKECFPNSMCCRSGDFVRVRSRSFQTDFERILELFEKEARALAHIQHPNVVGVHQIFKDNGTTYMALDYVEGLDLLDVIEQKPELLGPEQIKIFLRELLAALSYVHSNGILHRDISPDNILLDHENTPILIDFGAAREGATRASRILSRVHTVKDGYSPQEFYLAGSMQCPSSDLYALAATFYHMITGFPPPNSNLRLAAVAENNPDPLEHLTGKYPDYDPLLLETIDQCLSLFSRDRIESAEVWLQIIEEGHRQPVQVPTVREEKQIELKIAALVEENHQAIKEEEARALEIAIQPPPEPPEDPAAIAEREYWAILTEELPEEDDEDDLDEDWEEDMADAEDPWDEKTEDEVELEEQAIAAMSAASAPRKRFSLAALLPWSGRKRRDTQNMQPL